VLGSAGEAQDEEADGPFVPIPGPQYRLDDDHFLVLGWSSVGSGLQSLHALLIARQDDALILARQLDLQTDRPSAGLVVRRAGPGEVRLGIPERTKYLAPQRLSSVAPQPCPLRSSSG
jgi:hypothetical protein